MRVVIDTNVLASALIRRQGRSGQVLRHLRDGSFTIVYSVPLMMELVEVLSRSQIQKKYHILSDDVTALINLVRLRGQLVSPHRQINAYRDPKDNRFLEAAVEGNADMIVSGDADLLEMREFERIPILSVAEFLAQL
ncbi:MAG TPA: putative toxin-antitoxin system toxin component, PIN family [Anaerolineales bacterium]|nr:putative toxin-antitoxin system toxin component, PIN family [Anaerolineales bacterium]